MRTWDRSPHEVSAIKLQSLPTVSVDSIFNLGSVLGDQDEALSDWWPRRQRTLILILVEKGDAALTPVLISFAFHAITVLTAQRETKDAAEKARHLVEGDVACRTT